MMGFGGRFGGGALNQYQRGMEFSRPPIAQQQMQVPSPRQGPVGMPGRGRGGYGRNLGPMLQKRTAPSLPPGGPPGAGGRAGGLRQMMTQMRGSPRVQSGGGLRQMGGAPPVKTPPGSRIAPPPGKFPGGGHPNLGGRNPLMRQANERNRPMGGGRRAMPFMR